MTASRGINKKSPNTPHDTINLIDAWHTKHIQKLDEKKKPLDAATPTGSYKYIKYPKGKNFDTVVEEIGLGACRSAVRNRLFHKFPAKLIPQQVNKRTPRPQPAPAPAIVEPAVVVVPPSDLMERLAGRVMDLEGYRVRHRTDINTLARQVQEQHDEITQLRTLVKSLLARLGEPVPA